MLDNFTESDETKLLKLIGKFQFCNNDFIYLIAILSGFTRRKRIKLFLEQMEICTRGMDELKVSKNYSSLSRYQYIAGIFLSFLILGEVLWLSDIKLSSYIDYSSILMMYYIYVYPVIIMMITDFTFVFWIRQLNAILQNMLTTTIDSPQHKRMRRMKDNWEDDSSLSTLYGTYEAYENLAKLKRVKQIHLELMKCASILNEIVAITNTCQRTITEICRFMYQLIENRLMFTVCRFYDLDHTFIYNAIGSIMTYLVIFLQVGDKPNKTRHFTLQIESCIRTMEQLNIPMNLSKCLKQQCYQLIFELYSHSGYIRIKFSQLNDLLRSMLTTTVDSPQHKRVLRRENINRNDPPSNNIRRTYKSDDDTMKIKKVRIELH
ncbi:gustatory receptor for sugar taste 43a-like [Vespula maculifrons]|uniref:Gustatory receptor n=1 Tax=Vespula maculifrons TaxID=7453 RepID=A0ABD2CPU4_VESMC